jgi:hypothetical protein
MLATTMKNSLSTKISKKPIDIVGNTLTKQRNESTFRRHNPYTPRQEEPPVRSISPGGRKTTSCLGMCSEGLGLPGKPWWVKPWLRTLGPGVRGIRPRGRIKEGRGATYHGS